MAGIGSVDVTLGKSPQSGGKAFGFDCDGMVFLSIHHMACSCLFLCGTPTAQVWKGMIPSTQADVIAAGSVWRGLTGLPHAKSSRVMAPLRETTGRSMRRKAVSILGRHIETGPVWRKLTRLDHAKEVDAGG